MSAGLSIAAEVAAALVEVGEAVGDGEFTVTIERQGEQTGDDWNPSFGEPTSHNFSAMRISDKRARDAGYSVEAGERVYMLANSETEIAPTTGDSFSIDEKDWAINKVEEFNPAGVAVYWKVKVAR